ncbi:MAG TPA: tRNA epoxyqueuosine(34) reductase QueG [Anaerolineales bacterium]|nr:tRNA epoxyqueuosine(34) reductase QueG [Anaerolineales bacterium]
MIPPSGESGASLKEDIKQEARRLGFVLAGFASPEPPSHAAFFERWLDHGYHGEMSYLSTERSRVCRGDPREIMPECRSILVLALPYSNPTLAEPGAMQPGAKPRARVAAYAWGRDYHDVIPERVGALVAFIERRAGRKVSSRCYTDSGPILERDLAQRAGLGWIGKNTCLINPRMGSYLLLAEVLLDLDVQLDAAFRTDHCGSCTRCVEACPTDCILPDRTLDAQRCISYLTIELKSAIPLELRPRMGAWIFGCDICQIVCPWNRFAAARGDEALAGPAHAEAPDLIEQLGISPEEFGSRSRGSALRRAKHRGFLRNVTVAAGNVAGNEARVPLYELAQNQDQVVKDHAAWALGRVIQRNSENA